MKSVRDEAIKTLKYSIYGGMAFFFLILAFVFVTESSFGQRCEKEGRKWGSDDWAKCVNDLSSGRST